MILHIPIGEVILHLPMTLSVGHGWGYSTGLAYCVGEGHGYRQVAHGPDWPAERAFYSSGAGG